MQDSLPLVTVIMPIYNEAVFIERSLGAVLAQDYPKDRMEVLVVDGRSTDWTRELVSQMAGQDKRIKLLDNPCRDQASALNIGIAEARGEVIVRVDGHAEISPNYIRICLDVMRQTGAASVGGRIDSVGLTPLSEAIGHAMSSFFGTGGSRFRSGNRPGYVDTVAFGAFRRDVFDWVGTFDPAAVPNEDYELNYRLRAKGGRIYFTPEIRSRYYVRSSFRALSRQYLRYGWRKAFMIRRHPDSVHPRHLAAPGFVGALLVGLFGAWLHPWLAWGLVVLLVAYSVAVLIASAGIAVRHGWRHVVYLIAIFPVLHIMWGTGFWAGAIAQLLGRKG